MPSTRPPEVLQPGCIYSSREFKSRLRIGEATWRRLKREGLRVHRVGKTVVVMTDDFHTFLSSMETTSNGQNSG
jgi:hypothetical protein